VGSGVSVGAIIGLLIVLAVFAWALRPLFAQRRSRPRREAERGERTLEDLLFEREAALVAIRDLQLDHSMGKMGDEDFADLNGDLRAQAIALMQELDALGVSGGMEDAAEADVALDAWIERAVAEARNARGRAAPSLSPDSYASSEVPQPPGL
jgi:hypothetical protein